MRGKQNDEYEFFRKDKRWQTDSAVTIAPASPGNAKGGRTRPGSDQRRSDWLAHDYRCIR